MATLIKADTAGIADAAARLRAGTLVAFPTETVYGLGANAFCAEAVLKIFEYKGRPLSDPLIVHVPNLEKALPLVVLTPEDKTVFVALANAFWPGPLTLVGLACPELPSLLTANTGFVGVRCPSLPLARELLEVADVPVAAPSANRFGHVSPTTAAHVMKDLGAYPIGVLDGGETGKECEVGIESTVVKVDSAKSEVVVFRRGGVSLEALTRVLTEAAPHLRITVLSKTVAHKPDAPEEAEGQQAPGQLLTHYAPDVTTFLARLGSPGDDAKVADDVDLATAVIVDFHGALACLKDKVLAYQDLSATGDVLEARSSVFATLRWAETVEGATAVLLSNLDGEVGEHLDAVADRLFRAASGRKLIVDTSSSKVFVA